MEKKINFSIIIPTYNEGEDARLSIESSINQTLKPLEIVVVDDSTDNTPEIIKEYKDKGVILVNGPRKGCCEAMNFGIQNAKGDIVIELDSDVVLPPDFLERISKHYQAGADWVINEAKVFNDENFYANFIEAHQRLNQRIREKQRKTGNQYYTEGISFKKSAALAVGIYTGDYPIRFCRDWTLGKKLTEAGYKKIYDPSIIVTHKSPDNFKEYWHVRKNRGLYSALTQYFILKRSLLFLFPRAIYKNIRFLLNFLLIFPALIEVFKHYFQSDIKGVKMFFQLWFAYFIKELAFNVGEWEGIKAIVKT